MSLLLDPDEIARAIVEELWQTFGCYLAVILRIDADGKLRPVAGAGDLVHEMGEEFDEWEQSMDEGVAGRVARTGEPAVVADTRLDPDFVGTESQLGGGSELAVPIRVAGEIWGVLNMDSPGPGHVRRGGPAVRRRGGRPRRRCSAPQPPVLRSSSPPSPPRSPCSRTRSRRRTPTPPPTPTTWPTSRCTWPSAWAWGRRSCARSATARCCTTSARSG